MCYDVCMAEMVDGPDFVPGPKGAPRKYPWDDWQNGRRWVVFSGVDFQPSAEKFLPQIYQRARISNMKVACRLRGARGEIEFQFFPGQPHK